MKSKCNVAKDLMPLVIDGVASEESQQYVDEHIAECTECALTYGAMKVELPRANQEKERAEMEKAAKAVKKKRRKRIILAGVLGALMSIVLFSASNWLYHRLTMSTQYPMDKDEFTFQLYKKSDGSGMIVLDMVQDDAICGFSSGYGNGIVNLSMVEPAIQLGDERYEKMYGGYRTWELGFLDERGWMNFAEWAWLGGGKDGRETYLERNQEPIKEIWINYGDGQELIYTHGDEVPICSPEMEAYLDYLQNPLGKGKYGMEYDYDKLAELRNAVPEWQ